MNIYMKYLLLFSKKFKRRKPQANERVVNIEVIKTKRDDLQSVKMHPSI